MDISPNDKTMDDQHLKEENQDAEIDKMAMEITKQNKIKMTLLKKTAVPSDNRPPVAPTPTPEILSEDSSSAHGKFGWTQLAKTCFPYIMRSKEKYVALRMIEMKIFPKYPSKEIATCIDVDRFKLTKVEAGLLNEINIHHTDNYFGSDSFTEHEDLIHLHDAIGIENFLEFCHKNLRQDAKNKRYGFIRLNGMYLPYVWWDCKRYTPLFYLDGEVKYLEEKSVELRGWALAYLKLLCKVHNTFKSIQDQKSILVVDLEIVKECFVPGTPCEEMWPINNKIEALLGQTSASAIKNNENQKNYEITPQGETALNAKSPDVANPSVQSQRTPTFQCPNVNPFKTSTSVNFNSAPPHARFKVAPEKRYERRAPYKVQDRPLQNGYSNQAVASVPNQAVTVPQSVLTNKAISSNSDEAVVGVANHTLTVQQSALVFLTNRSKQTCKSLLMSCQRLPPFMDQMQPVTVPNPRNKRMCILLQIPNFNVANNRTAYTLKTYRVGNITLEHSINIAPDDGFVLVTLNEVLCTLVKVPYPILKQAIDYLRFYVFLPNKAQADLLTSTGLFPGMGLVSGIDLKFYYSKLRMVCQNILKNLAPS